MFPKDFKFSSSGVKVITSCQYFDVDVDVYRLYRFGSCFPDATGDSPLQFRDILNFRNNLSKSLILLL